MVSDTRWHQMETYSVLLALCAGNSLVTSEFPWQRPVTWSFNYFFDLHLNKQLSKQSWDWWFEMPLCSLWHLCNVLKQIETLFSYSLCSCFSAEWEDHREQFPVLVGNAWGKSVSLIARFMWLTWVPFAGRQDPGGPHVGPINLNRHQTILHTFLNFFLNLTLPGVPHLYKQLPNGQYLSDLCKMCNLEANLWKSWIGDHRILTYIFKWERLNIAGHSHSVSICHWVVPLHND